MELDAEVLHPSPFMRIAARLMETEGATVFIQPSNQDCHICLQTLLT